MEIRKGSIKDFDAILDLQIQLDDAELKFDDNLTEYCYKTESGQEKLKKRLRSRKNICYVAVKDNKIVGFIDGYIMNDAWWYKEKVAYLDHICVDKKYRKNGIGSLLFETFEKKVIESNIKDIRILAFPNNIPAISLYKKYGCLEYSVYYNKRVR